MRLASELYDAINALKIDSLKKPAPTRPSSDRILEAFETKKFTKGQVLFSKTKIDDPHIKKAIKIIAEKSGFPESAVKNDIENGIKKFDDIAKIAPVLYNTIKLNIVENETFNLMQKYKTENKHIEKFNFVTFNKLFNYIKIDHDEFFPLRNLFSNKYLHNPRVIMVPSSNPENKHFNNVPTACATENGEFVFNLTFMQHLMDWAHLKGVIPKGKKYVVNGGDIPNEYCYIEFLIIHELLHFSQGDFHYHKRYKVSAKLINWVGDFRSNYTLVKSGYEQLPMGLFNDEINYDRQNTYKEMVEVVKAEFAKLNKAQQDKINKQLDKMGDDHDAKNKRPIKVGDKVKLPDGSPAIVKSINNGKVEVERIS